MELKTSERYRTFIQMYFVNNLIDVHPNLDSFPESQWISINWSQLTNDARKAADSIRNHTANKGMSRVEYFRFSIWFLELNEAENFSLRFSITFFLIDFNPLENIVIKKLSFPAFCRFLSGGCLP